MRYFVDEPDENGEVLPRTVKEVPQEESAQKETAQTEIKKE